MKDASKLTPGTAVGEWTLLRKLGEGGMGVVFEARRRAGETAALKIVRPELLAVGDHAARFQREGRVLQRVDHRNVVGLIDVGEADGFPYLALTFIEGDSLASYLEEGPLPKDEALRFAADVLRGLAAVHDAGILHRDLKPGNVMLSREGDWKITDFGLARRETGESIAVTQPGALLGTPYYMSPEMCLGEPLDARSDLYSAGATIYHAVTGEALFKSKTKSKSSSSKGTSVMEVITAHIREKAPSLAEKVPGISPALSNLVARLLEKRGEDRPANARAALAMIESELPPLPAPAAEVAPRRAPGADTVASPPSVAATSFAPASFDALAQTRLGMPAPARPPAAPAAAPTRPPAASLPRPTAPAPPRTPATGPRVPSPPDAGSALPPRAAGTGTASRIRLTPSGRVPGIVKPASTPRGKRIPWERATVPLSPALLLGLLWTLSRISGQPQSFDKYLDPSVVLWAALAGALVGAFRVFTGFYEVNAPPIAKAKSFYARVALRLKVKNLRVSRPKLAAEALLALGEPAEAAALLAHAGLLREAAAEYLRQNDLARAARLFERVNDVDAAIDAYARLGDPRAATLALDLGRFVEAARIHADQGAPAQAAAAYQQAGLRLEAANAFEAAGRHEEAGEELVRALEDREGPLAQLSADDRHAHAGRAAELFARGGKPLAAAARLEALEEHPSALHLFEQAGAFADAARVAAKLGHHEQAADLYTKAGLPLEAARERGEAMLADKTIVAPRGSLGAADSAASAASLTAAARCFEAAREPGRAADLFARAGDLATAARLYEQAGASREAALCLRHMGDGAAAARALERSDPLAAAEAFVAAGEPEEALRVIQSLPESISGRGRAVALMGDMHLAAGHESEAVEAYQAALAESVALDPLQVAHVVDALVGLGRLDQAIDELSSVRHRLGDSPELDRLATELGTRKRTSKGGEDLVGCVVDRYRVRSLLGEGGTAWVYAAEHTFLGRIVALKVLKPHPTGGKDLAERFYAEAQATAALSHPNIVHVFDVGATPGGLLYMALELVKGDGLRGLLDRAGKLPTGVAAWIMKGVLEGLAVAHARGIVHRDMKPENILLGPGDRPKVVDFGIAKVVASKVATMTGAFLGTPKYASPEQAQGVTATLATDIYACGLILYEMLAGRSPFESETPLGFLTKHATAIPPPLENVAPGVPSPLAAAVMRALEKDPARRWPDAESFMGAVAPYAQAPGTKPAPLAATYVQEPLPVVVVAKPAPAPVDGDEATNAAIGPGTSPVAVQDEPPAAGVSA